MLSEASRERWGWGMLSTSRDHIIVKVYELLGDQMAEWTILCPSRVSHAAVATIRPCRGSEKQKCQHVLINEALVIMRLNNVWRVQIIRRSAHSAELYM